jgi:hypothetical protein
MKPAHCGEGGLGHPTREPGFADPEPDGLEKLRVGKTVSHGPNMVGLAVMR